MIMLHESSSEGVFRARMFRRKHRVWKAKGRHAGNFAGALGVVTVAHIGSIVRMRTAGRKAMFKRALPAVCRA